LSEKDENNNAINTDFSVTETAENNLIYSEGKKIIALADVNDIAVIETDYAILVCDINKAQNVKQVVNQLRDNKDLKQYL